MRPSLISHDPIATVPASRAKDSELVELATGDEHENLVRERCQPLLCRSGDQVPSGWDERHREAHRRGLLHRPSLRSGLLPGLWRCLNGRSRAVFDAH